MAQHLLLSVRIHGDARGTARYHGVAQGGPEWPPSPARLYQALVAGVARGDGVPRTIVPALEWFEALPPPTIAAPHRRLGRSVTLYVPNNDADALDDPRDLSTVRTKKVVQPSLFADDQPILYAWPVAAPSDHAEAVVEAAREVYQLGRGVDMAWVVAEVVDDEGLGARLGSHPGVVYRPESTTRSTRMLGCPVAGSLASLERRHQTVKLFAEGSGRERRVLFTNPPKARFASVSYERAEARRLFELREREDGKPWPWALGRVVRLVEKLRDAAAGRLRQGLPGSELQIESTLIGRKANGGDAAGGRARIVPLPSIGFVHADRAIRRFLLELPSGLPLSSDDLDWAFSGLEWADPETGEVSPWIATRTTDDAMLRHYLGPSRRWRSVTPVALPGGGRRRRSEPTGDGDSARAGAKRSEEEGRAARAVSTALRHAGVRAAVLVASVQREPFEANGARAETFAAGTRFARQRLWHVDVELDRPIEGPLVLGDGRFLGLGVMAPAADACNGIYAFRAEGVRGEVLQVSELTRALRRAVMARAQDVLGRRASLPPFFVGHADDGGPARRDEAAHLAFAFDGRTNRLLILAPHMLERRAPRVAESEHMRTLERALDGFRELRVGTAGQLTLHRITIDSDRDALLGPAQTWRSETLYRVTRHAKERDARAALAHDVRAECDRAGLPAARIDVSEGRGVPGLGLVGHVQLAFDVAVRGPILLGRDRHFGGGLFGGVSRGS